MSVSSWKQAGTVAVGERIVVFGDWCSVVDFKPGRARYDATKNTTRKTWTLIIDAKDGLREVTYWFDETISVRPRREL